MSNPGTDLSDLLREVRGSPGIVKSAVPDGPRNGAKGFGISAGKAVSNTDLSDLLGSGPIKLLARIEPH